MDLSEARSRAVRFMRIVALLYQHPDGLTARELARHCGCHTRTIQRDLQALQNDLRVGMELRGGSRYVVRKGHVLAQLQLDLPEAVALYLAARTLHRRPEVRIPHVLAAMKRLAEAFPERLASELQESLRGERPGRVATAVIFERLSVGWAARRRLRMAYRSFGRPEHQSYVVDPYLIEVAGYNQGIYVIAYSHTHGSLRTFKLERIRDVDVLDEVFERPDTSALWQQLRQSWGIVFGDVQRVRVRFAPSAAQRVRETEWHPSQHIRTLADGGCELDMYVPSFTELLPWLRGWGADAEVVEPPELRRQIADEARRLAARYEAL
ncbi:MAG: WYL domain-containing protein [Chloroflexi bacterium]|nr:WYL domain-containing protein [Chloroflexota bacterium]